MKIRTTLILFGILLFGLGIFALLQLLDIKPSEERAELSTFLLPSLNLEKQAMMGQASRKPINPSTFNTVKIERLDPATQQRETWEWLRENNQWKMVAPHSFRADENAVSGLVSQIASAQRESTTDLTSPLADYGLDQPRFTVTLTKGDQTYTVKVGKQGPAAKDPVFYAVSSETDSKPVAVRKSRIDKLFEPLGHYRGKRFFTSSFGINEIQLAGAARSPLHLKLENGVWKYLQPNLGHADAAQVQSLSTELAALQVEQPSDFVYDGPLDEATLKKYGLVPGQEAYAITLSQPKPGGDAASTITEKVHIGVVESEETVDQAQRAALAFLHPPSAWGWPVIAAAVMSEKLKVNPAGGAKQYYAMKQGENSIMRLRSPQDAGTWPLLAALDKKVDDLRSRQLLQLEVAKLDAIDLATGGDKLRLRRPVMKADGSSPADWQIHSDQRAKTPAHLPTIESLINACNRAALHDARGFLDDETRQKAWFGNDPINLGLDQPLAEITFWLEALVRDDAGKVTNENEPPFKDGVKDRPAAKLTIGRKDDARQVVYVRRELPGQNPVILAIPDPWLPPPNPNLPQPADPRQVFSLSRLASGGFLAFRDRSLPSLRADLAHALTVQKGGQQLEMVKEEKKDDKGATTIHWKMLKPVEAASPAAEFLILNLNQWSADALINDRATPKDWEEKFGLGSKPFMRFTLASKPGEGGKAQTYSYLIGNKIENHDAYPNHVYARLEVEGAETPIGDSQGFVFALPWSMVQTLDVELRDTIIFAHDPNAKPVKMTFVWKQREPGQPLKETRLEAAWDEEKKQWLSKSLSVDGKAVAELPSLDQGKIQGMLTASGLPSSRATGPKLNPLQADRFLIYTGTIDPAWRVLADNVDHPPQLTWTIEDGQGQAKTLYLGAAYEPKEMDMPSLAGRKFLMAASSTVPGAVFLIDQASYEDLARSMDYLKAAAAPPTTPSPSTHP